jgi:myo-inositol-1(or 4)-monophosphatase
LHEITRVAVEAAQGGAEVLRHWFGRSDLESHEKAQNDFVSRADRESEETVLAVIRSHFPDHHVLAEEGGRSGGHRSSEYEWVVDPLDGTTNFLRGVPFFCVSVACRRAGRLQAGVVLDPLRDDLFVASAGAGATRNGEVMRVAPQAAVAGAVLATGFPFKAHPALDAYLSLFRDVFLDARAIRRCGAAALDLAYTAAGVFDGFFEFRLAPWDVAAGALLVREAGGLVSDLDGGEGFVASGNVVAGSPGLQQELQRRIAAHATEQRLDDLVPRT